MRERWRPKAILIALAALNLVAYGQIVGHQDVSFDTADYLYENRMVRDGFSLEGIAWAFDPRHAYAANWHPLTWLSHMLDCQLFGLERLGGHLAMNLALHIASTWLLFLVLWKMTRQDQPKGKRPLETAPSSDPALWQSALVAALFAIHPLHVESVAWLAERKDVLSGFFWILTMGAYAWYVARPGWRRMTVVAACLTLGLMSKPMVVTLPCALLLLDVWPLGRVTWDISAQAAARWGRLFLEKLPLFALVAATSVMTFIVQRQAGAVNVADSFGVRLAKGIWAYGMYLTKMCWPFNLACFYPQADAGQGENSGLGYRWLVMLVPLILITVLAVVERRRRPYLLVGWLWYLGTLVPVVGIFVKAGEQAFADRFTYVPLIGIFIMLAWGLGDLLAARPAFRTAAATACVALIVVLTALSWRQTQTWYDTETLFRHATLVTDRNAFAHTTLGLELRRQQRFDEALVECQRAVDIDQLDWNNHYNLALLLIDLNRLNEAREHAQRAAQLHPRVGGPHAALGLILAQQKQYQSSIEALETSLRLAPDQFAARLLLAGSLSAAGRTQEAVDEYRRAASLEPNNPGAWAGLASALMAVGNRREALKAIEQAITLAPENADYRLASAQVLASLGERQAALGRAQQVLAAHPEHLEAAMLESDLLMADGQLEEALAKYRQLAARYPDQPAVANNLAWLLASRGKGPDDAAEAVMFAERVNRSAPDNPVYLDSLALAYAAVGRFDDAARAAERAIELTRKTGNEPLARQVSERLKSYRAGRMPVVD